MYSNSPTSSSTLFAHFVHLLSSSILLLYGFGVCLLTCFAPPTLIACPPHLPSLSILLIFNGATKAGVSGVFPADPTKIHKVTILNGSYRTVSDNDDKETVLVFPNYKVVNEVEVSPASAEELWEHALSPSVNLHSAPRDLKGTSMKSWINRLSPPALPSSMPAPPILIDCAHCPLLSSIITTSVPHFCPLIAHSRPLS
ncbi:hypothetical protein L226DRAFT_576758 [Lentinus tigrinus ALCF2SS1-7]|uniref:Uncharacterized protein n=1 Tax=Lentinus tigrinus ALCF2SS1-6 TaxID=1328759 RepID=A0A5C2RMZ1_9APHY|nr:hypothetical protein L227DRAFT_617617 [Lentinus tigrinus ALCF2SS1-6]RPD68020.1 hypothetical protein L226DRAFT_576758 [Lentinus tigrinus ALCF2SS1-7]